MRCLLRWLFIVGLFSVAAFGQALSGVNRDCQLGGQQALTSGLPSTATQQIGTTNVNAGAGVSASFPQCLVTVYLTGTTNKATIYADGSLTPQVLSNPFVANVDGSFTFFAATGCYDVVMSSGAGPALPYSKPLPGICVGQGTVVVPGGSGTVGSCGTPGAIPVYTVAGTTISCDPNFTTDGSGNVIATSMTFNGAGAGFVGFVQGTVPPLSVLNTAYIYSDTSIPTTFGTALPTSAGALGAVLGITSVVDATHIKTGWTSLPALSVTQFGVVGDGVTDDTTAMQSALNYVCNTAATFGGGRTLTAPPNFSILISSTISLNSCGGVHIDFGSGQGQFGFNTSGFVWNGAIGGTMFLVNGVRDSIFENFYLNIGYVNGGNTHNASIGLDIDKISGSIITTNNLFNDIAIWFGGNVTRDANFVGVRLGKLAPGNVDQQEFDRIFIGCPGPAPTNNTSNGIGFLLAAGAGAEPYDTIIHNSTVLNCSRAHDVENSISVVDINHGFMTNNWTDLFVGNGNNIVYRDIRSEGGKAQLDLTGGVTASNLVLSGLTSSTTTVSLNGNFQYQLNNLQWDNVAVTPLTTNVSASVSIRNSKFPGSSCPDLTTFGGIAESVMNRSYSGSCKNFWMGSGADFGVVAKTASVANSPIWHWDGSYQVSGGVFAADSWTVQDVVGSGNNGTSVLTFLHAGSSGRSTVSFPGTVSFPRYQTTLSTPASSSDTCTAGETWADTGFVYVCTSTNTIKRAALGAF